MSESEWGEDYDDSGAGTGSTEAEAPALYYGSVDEFVRDFLIHQYRRRVGPTRSFHWSRQWWRSGEAISRLESLWRAWEHLRLDPATGMSVWWRDHADHHMAVLFSAEGPFGNSQDENGRDESLPYSPPPAGMFPDLRET